MRSNINLFASAAMVSLVGAATYTVDVGKNGLTFTPDSIPAAPGDVVEFHYYPKNHTVAQSLFTAPCNGSSLPNPIFSGFIPVASGEGPNVFRVTVNDTKPIWFYCGQVSHCQSGMVGVINEPTSGANTLAAYKAAAQATSSSTTPFAISGGVFALNSEGSGSSSSSVSGSGTASHTGSAGSSRGSATGTATGSATGSASATGTTPGSGTATSSSAVPTASKAGAVALKSVRWSELLGMGAAVAGAAVFMQ